MMKARNLGKLKAMRLGATKVMPIPGPENEEEGKYLSEGAAREWSTVVIVIVIFIS